MLGAGVACTGGVNRLPPLGLMLFSVGEAGVLLGGGVVVVVDVVVEAGGPWLPALPQAAIRAPIPMSAAPPRTAAKRGPTRSEFMSSSPSSRGLGLPSEVGGGYGLAICGGEHLAARWGPQGLSPVVRTSFRRLG
jgi:hypothetical protein